MMEPQGAAAEQVTVGGQNGSDADVRTLRNRIGSEWVASEATDFLEDRNPATGELLARVPLSTAGDVDRAVTAARAAQAEWGATAPQRRARAVFALRNALWEHHEELAQLVTKDMGKTLDDARGEVLRGIESAEAACGIPALLKGENLEGIAKSMDVEQWRQPVGVVAAITPFNFPVMIPLWFLPFAIATGNTIVLKPSERDPLTSERIFELIEEIDELPPGVANLVHGAHDSVNALLDHPEIDAISFVGQASTARHVVERAAPGGKRVQALGGANRQHRRANQTGLAAGVRTQPHRQRTWPSGNAPPRATNSLRKKRKRPTPCACIPLPCSAELQRIHLCRLRQLLFVLLRLPLKTAQTLHFITFERGFLCSIESLCVPI